MKKIDIITGFLEGGKTSFIQSLLERVIPNDKKIIIIQCEEGIEELDIKKLNEKNIIILNIDSIEELSEDFFKKLDTTYDIERIIIEYNGTWQIDKLIKIDLPTKYIFGEVMCIANAKTFVSYTSNMGDIIPEQIVNSDTIVLNRYEGLNKDDLSAITQTAKTFNRKARIIFDKEYDKIDKEFSSFEEKHSSEQYKVFVVIISFWILYMLLDISQLPVFNGNFDVISTINTVFISILIQAIPFILIGVFVSSALQVFIPDQKMIKLFNKNKWLAFPIAAIMGVFFPVCDCAMAPIITRLVKKGVSVPLAFTFMLASQAVNPVVIFSTLNAFPDNHMIAVYRIVIGITIAVLTGIILNIMSVKNEDVLKASYAQSYCSSGYIGTISSQGIMGKIEALFRHAGIEFLYTAKYVMLGAFISAVIQSVIPKSILTSAQIFPFAIMILAAFFMSVCSTSNAFIGRSFSSVFPTTSILLYMVIGPMLDFKNLLMLSSSIKKKFLFKLIIIIIIIALAVFTIIGRAANL